MALNNPAFNNPAFQDPRAGGANTRYSPPPAVDPAAAASIEGAYAAPSASAVDTGRMTVEDTVMKTLALFGILVVTAVVGWIWSMAGVSAANPNPSAAPMIVGGLVGFVLAMVATFKKKPSVPVFIAYAAFEGLFVGGISAFFEFIFPGIVLQATLGTLSVVGVTLALFASGKIRASARATKIFMIAMVGYMVFALLNLGLMLFNVPIAGGAFGLYSMKIAGIPLGLVIGVFVVIMAAYSLVLDFDQIQRGVRNGAARVYGWVGAFGIMVTVVWLYVEILRMIAILRGNN
ncbi:putative YccA/Bax inhibitor family protein [Microbacterium testaceum]|uniref:Bax inhibitor-1/YccA family protein n=1 Tax=Microbacterium TaxID=33882 RepID=UPI00277DAE7F|nr:MULTISPECIES: Bax inhibitor-1/YccA family protein [Microbacterium]MDQ1112810.1 putative YccA/Bax inhibitor family protein [Microbacterium testaceum]MDQ1176941.1 putative YccA/Bax inhibitor family protein [Microbacterium sp. SORGH_AS_0421]MDR6096652.1 putative YccA/Bax inhibitor family protein [Microbacterium sp. SORGH_AS_0454]